MYNYNINEFSEFGYVILKKIFNNKEIQNIKNAIYAPLAILSNQVDKKDILWEDIEKLSVKLKQNSTSAYLNAIRISQNDPKILASSNNENLLNGLRSIGLSHPVVSLKPFLVLVSPELYVEGGYNLRPYHQEWPVIQGSEDSVVSWTALHDVDERHNAVELIPNSHKDQLRNYSITSCGTTVTRESMPEDKPIRIHLKAGETLVFSSFMIHRSSPKGRNFRAALTIRYNNLNSEKFIKRFFKDPYKLEIDRDPKTVYNPKV